MTHLAAFKCCSCGGGIESPYRSLDRRVVSLTHPESLRGDALLQIHLAQEMFVYCGSACATAHLAAVATELELHEMFPETAPVSPCSRCMAPVFRARPHVTYAAVQTALSERNAGLAGHVLGDTDIAILCPRCENPSDGAAVHGAEVERGVERA